VTTTDAHPPSAATGDGSETPRGPNGSRSASRLTGERPQQGVTPDSLLALHAAGYRAVRERLGDGPLLDVGCGQGFESVTLGAPGRPVVGVDYSADATDAVRQRFGAGELRTGRMDALHLGLADGSFRWACSSHIIEHFTEPERHVAELARVLADDGTAFFLTPNEPADFENPFHVHLFGYAELVETLLQHFAEVSVGGVDAVERVKADLAARRVKAHRLLALDVFDLRHAIPRSWYIWAYIHLLPLAYRLVAREDTGGTTGITVDDWFVTDAVDDTTPVLFAVARRPRRAGSTATRTPG
jgi:SAM-dependent methyltransferase